ncbi:NS7c protein [Quail coronavirus UAE-HKU30]|nr:NS7c protein [Quail coronavirus UAE-HKU30]
MFGLGYFYIKYITLTILGYYDPPVAEVVGSFVDFQLAGMLSFIIWEFLHPPGAEPYPVLHIAREPVRGRYKAN